jgi:hypothetical protein
VEQRSIDDPNETRPYAANGHMDVVTLGDFTLGRGTFEPGWQWSKDIKQSPAPSRAWSGTPAFACPAR